MIVYMLTSWVWAGESYTTKLWSDLLQSGTITYTGEYCRDVSQTPEIEPTPNVVVVELSITQAAFDWLENHPDYGPGAILYDLPNPYGPNDKPPAAEFGLRRSYCARLGMSNARFTALFGTNANPKTRKDGADSLIAWVKTLPKGKDK